MGVLQMEWCSGQRRQCAPQTGQENPTRQSQRKTPPESEENSVCSFVTESHESFYNVSISRHQMCGLQIFSLILYVTFYFYFETGILGSRLHTPVPWSLIPTATMWRHPKRLSTEQRIKNVAYT